MDDLKVNHQDHVLVFTLNRPARKNALTQDMYRAITGAWKQAESDNSARAVVFLGSGGNFCAGNDLADFPDNPEQGGPTAVWDFIETVVRSNLPIVAAVEGVAAGIGATMLLHMDSVVASAESRIFYSFINMALVPEAGSSLLLTERLGYTRAAELLLRGAPITGDEAHALGIVSTLSKPGAEQARALEIAAEFAAKPAAAMQRTRQLLKGDPERILQRIRDEEKQLFKQFASAEFAEATAAFREKRKPDFSAT